MKQTDSTKNTEDQTLDSYIRGIEDQDLKGMLLKLKNETRKPEATWEAVRSVLISLCEKDQEAFGHAVRLSLKQGGP